LKEKRNLKKLKSHLDLKQLNEKPISAELVMIKKINDITPTEWNNQLPLPGMLYVRQKPKETKILPSDSGFINYFPRAIAAVSKVSLNGGIQHGQTEETLHWNRALSGDELDAMMRHVIDKDWEQVAWRAMANLEKQLEKEHN
jgi:hypothetical protein